MTDLTFAQPARRSLLLPILAALALLGIVVALIVKYTPHHTADIAITHVAVYPSHLVFKSNSIVIGRDQVEDDLYVLSTVRIANTLKLPLFLKDFTASLIPSDGTLPLSTSAIEKPDLANLYATFPALRQMAATGAAPLFRETEIAPGQTAEGLILLHFPTTEKAWNDRQNATLSIDLYHQPALTVGFPKAPPQVPAAAPDSPRHP